MTKTKNIFLKMQWAIWNNVGQTYVDTGVKMLITIVIGALLLTGLYGIFSDIVLKNVSGTIQDFFVQTPTLSNAPDGAGGSGGGNGSGDNPNAGPDDTLPYAYALVLDNSINPNDAKPMIFVREEVTPVVGETYISETYGALPIIAVYENFEDVSNYSFYLDEEYGDVYGPFPSWVINPNTSSNSIAATITSVIFEDKVSPVNTCAWFAWFENCDNFNLAKLDSSAVTKMDGMFYDAGRNVATLNLDVSNLNTSKVTTMRWMFSCLGLNANTINLTGLENWNTSSVIQFSSMFEYTGKNASAFKLDLSGWDTSAAVYMGHMFSNCIPLETIYVSENWSVANVSSVGNYMFSNCNNLSGAVSYDYANTGTNMANYKNGYLTYKATN